MTVDKGHTLVAASTVEIDVKKELADKSTKMVEATQVGAMIARRAKEKGIEKVVFDRAGYLYHGRIKALADGAREAGLDF